MKCDTCDTVQGVNTYTHEGNEWNICPKCEETAEMAGEAYIAEIREAE